MDTDELIAALREEGAEVASAAERAGLDAPVPCCPGWHVRDTLVHLGSVHRWATECVAGHLERPPARLSEQEILAGGSEDDALVPWFRDGHCALVEALAQADEALSCWTFLAAPSPRAFWARRQAHETAVHRADVALSGGPPLRYPPLFAADGVDELVMGFASTGRSKGRADPPRTLLLATTDTDHAWRVSFGPDRVDTRGEGPSEGAVRAPASELYLLLWNRADPSAGAVAMTGETTLLDLWHGSLRIRWD